MPRDWVSTVTEADGLCKVEFTPPPYPARRGADKRDSRIWLEVYGGPFEEIADHWSFHPAAGKWICISQAETEARPLEGLRSPGLRCSITVRSYDDDGQYAGQGDGQVAVLFGKGRVVALQVRGASGHFDDILRSIHASD